MARVSGAGSTKGMKPGKPGRGIVKSVRRGGGTTGEGRGVLKEVRQIGRATATGRGASAKTVANRKAVYKEGRTIAKERGAKAAMKFNARVARVEGIAGRRATAKASSKSPVGKGKVSTKRKLS